MKQIKSKEIKSKKIKKNMEWKTVIVLVVPAIIPLLKWISIESTIVKIVKIVIEAIIR